jgi:hypothetical protein
MKVAVCFIGMIRTGVDVAHSLKNWFGGCYNHIDFFMHTWDHTESKMWHPDCAFLKNNAKVQDLNRQSTFDLLREFQAKYDNKFVSVEIENQDRFLSSPFFLPLTSFSPQWYSWYKGMQLIDSYEKVNKVRYDVIVKIRPDIVFPKDRSLAAELVHFSKDKTKLYTLGYDPVRIDDVMFLGNSDIMKRSSRFVIETNKQLWEANIVGEWLDSAGIQAVNTAHTDYCIYRQEHKEHGVDPSHFNRCVNIERDYYAPYNVDRLAEEEE